MALEKFDEIAKNLQSQKFKKSWYQDELGSLPSIEKIKQAVKHIRFVLYPELDSQPEGSIDCIEENLEAAYNILLQEVTIALLGDAEYMEASRDVRERRANWILGKYFEQFPEILRILNTDLDAIYRGDPAAFSHTEILLSYLSFQAILIYRVAHPLYEMGVPLIPRIMTEFAHQLTGVDINPGAEIGEYFFIDHGTGVVIGETAKVGNNVKLYQGVTLGALSLAKGRALKGVKRHPTINDNVVIYAGAAILGGRTTIGEGSVIGGGTFITRSVEPYSQVTIDVKKFPIKQVVKDKSDQAKK